jgi:DNA invertase Pin-like site-specific DNA recombinase
VRFKKLHCLHKRPITCTLQTVNSTKISHVISYSRVSTDEQAVSGLGLDAQGEMVEKTAAQRGWTIVESFVDAGVSGTVEPMQRPALAQALEMLEAGEAEALIVSKLDRASRSTLDLLKLLETAEAQGWDFVALDLGIDTSSPMGRAMASIAGTFAQLERDLISQRTRDALAVAKANGVKLGRPQEQTVENIHRIRKLTETGAGVRKIADTLNSEGRTTGRGGRWHPTTVHRVQQTNGISWAA